MKDWCSMVGGPCRGKNCDFWARIKIKKKSIEEMVKEILTKLEHEAGDNDSTPIQAIQEYWECLGVKNRKVLRKEKPDTSEKMKEVERRVLSQAARQEE